MYSTCNAVLINEKVKVYVKRLFSKRSNSKISNVSIIDQFFIWNWKAVEESFELVMFSIKDNKNTGGRWSLKVKVTIHM